MSDDVGRKMTTCPSCGASVPLGNHCPNCGAALVMRCVRCGASMLVSDHFCQKCGQDNSTEEISKFLAHKEEMRRNATRLAKRIAKFCLLAFFVIILVFAIASVVVRIKIDKHYEGYFTYDRFGFYDEHWVAHPFFVAYVIDRDIDGSPILDLYLFDEGTGEQLTRDDLVYAILSGISGEGWDDSDVPIFMYYYSNGNKEERVLSLLNHAQKPSASVRLTYRNNDFGIMFWKYRNVELNVRIINQYGMRIVWGQDKPMRRFAYNEYPPGLLRIV